MNKFNLNDIVVVTKKVVPLLAKYIGMKGKIISVSADGMFRVCFSNEGTTQEHSIGFWEKELNGVE